MTNSNAGKPPRLGRNIWDLAARVVLSMVVSILESIVTRACHVLPVLSISARLHRDFEPAVPHPEQLGAGRLANAAGALRLVYPPLLAVDAGAATTFCLIDQRAGPMSAAPSSQVSKPAGTAPMSGRANLSSLAE